MSNIIWDLFCKNFNVKALGIEKSDISEDGIGFDPSKADHVQITKSSSTIFLTRSFAGFNFRGYLSEDVFQKSWSFQRIEYWESGMSAPRDSTPVGRVAWIEKGGKWEVQVQEPFSKYPVRFGPKENPDLGFDNLEMAVRVISFVASHRLKWE